MKRLLPFVVLILVVIAALAAVPFLLQVDRHRDEVAQYLTRQIGRPVVIGKLEASLLPPTLRLRQVGIAAPEGGMPPAQIDRVDVGLDWQALFKLKVVPASVGFSNGQLLLHRKPDGRIDWEEWMRPAGGLAGKSQWPLRRLSLKSVDLRVVDPFGGASKEVVLQKLDGAVDVRSQTAQFAGDLALPSGRTVNFNFDGKGRFAVSGDWSGDVRFGDQGRVWVVHVTESAQGLDVRGDSKEWSLAHVAELLGFLSRWPSAFHQNKALLTNWRTHFTVSTSSGTFYHAAGIGSGLSEVKGEIVHDNGATVAQVRGAFEELPLATLVEGTPAAGLEGRLTGLVTNLHIAISSRPFSSLSGQGNASLKAGHYRFPARTLKSLSKTKTMAYLRSKFPDVETNGLPITDASGDWQATRGIVALNNGRGRSENIEVGVVGTWDVAREGLDAYLRLQIQETDRAKRKLIPGKYLFGPPGHEEIQPIFGRLQGHWQEWTLRAVASHKLPSTLATRLRQALTAPPSH